MLIEYYYSFSGMTIVLRINDDKLIEIIDSILGDIKSNCQENIIAVITGELCDEFYVFKERNRPFIKCKDIQIAALEITSSIINMFVHSSIDVLFLHAGAVQKNGKVFVFVGSSKSGKTSLVSVLINQYGYTFLSDEIVPITINAGNVLPFRRSLSIRKETLSFLHIDSSVFEDVSTIDNEKVKYISYKILSNGVIEETVHNEIAAIVFPHFGDIDEIKSLDAKKALTKILETSVNFKKIVHKGLDFLIELLPKVALYDLTVNDVKKTAKYVSELFEQGV